MILTLVFVSVLLSCLLVRAEWRGRQFAQMSCEQLMAELHAVRMGNISLVALEYPRICSKSDGLNAWSMFGGWRGLRRMHSNTGLLLALAEQAGAWDKQASKVALDAMRQDLLLFRRSAIYSLCRHAVAHGLELSSSDGYQIANAYHHMTELLLNLYRRSPSRLYTHLETAIWPLLPSVGAI